MRIGLFSDIHGNREAFAACLAHAAQSGIENYVFLGDYVGYGADPGWVVDTVMPMVERGAVALLGNHDAAVLRPGRRMNPDAEAAIAWTREQLTSEQRDFLESLPLTAEEGERLFVHADASAPEAWNYVIGELDAWRSLMATKRKQTFCGHVHVPMVFRLSATGKLADFKPVTGTAIPLLPSWQWLAVIGAVGQPRDRNPAACYAVLDDVANELTYVRVPYDVDTAARKIRAAGLPLGLSLRLESGT